MKILVAVKRVIDASASIRIKQDGSRVETNNMKFVMNPFDEIAVEEAVRLKENGKATEIIVVSIGPQTCQEILRTALALGSDRAIHILTDFDLSPLVIAKLLKSIVLKESPNLVILGKQAIDSDDNQVGQMLAGLLNWAQGTFASKIIMEDSFLHVTREIDGGLENLKLKLPAVITTDLRLNVPRYLSLPNIVQAKRKPISSVMPEELNVDLKSSIEIKQVSLPEKRRAGVKVTTVTELVNKLKNEARIL